MRSNTSHGLFGAVMGTVLFAGLMLLLGAGIVQLFLRSDGRSLLEIAALALCAAVCLATAVGVVAALIQRLREVKGGEEDEARKY